MSINIYKTIQKKQNNKNIKNDNINNKNFYIDRINYDGYAVYCVTHNKGFIMKLNFTHDEEIESALDYGNTYIHQLKDIISKKVCYCNNSSICNISLDGLCLQNKYIYGQSQSFYKICSNNKWNICNFSNLIIHQNSFI
jgi:hypothetical protein